MLRFRPIAPKPVTRDLGTSGLLVDNKNVSVTNKRVKRKYVRVCKRNQYKRKRKISRGDDDDASNNNNNNNNNNNVVTLQLLPEKSDFKESSDVDQTVTIKHVQDNYQDPHMFNMVGFGMSDQTAVMSWVTVESVTDTCMQGGEELGSTDMEKIDNLERDTCPGFISDGYNRVSWVNQAYRRMVMVSQKSDGLLPEMGVGLVVKEKLPCLCPVFTCQVKLQYTWQNEKCSKMVPCDVWRMDFGGFAWRLDVKAALSLGL